jgi:hypothetical protein
MPLSPRVIGSWAVTMLVSVGSEDITKISAPTRTAAAVKM